MMGGDSNGCVAKENEWLSRNGGDFGVTNCVLLRVRTNQWSSCWQVIETIGTIWKSFGSIPQSVLESETGDFSSMDLRRIHPAVISSWYPWSRKRAGLSVVWSHSLRLHISFGEVKRGIASYWTVEYCSFSLRAVVWISISEWVYCIFRVYNLVLFVNWKSTDYPSF